MQRQQSAGSKLRLTNSDEYKGYPILTNRGPLVEGYLEQTLTVIHNAVAEHPRTLAIRVDLRLPMYHQVVNSDLMSKFTESLKAQIRADLLRKEAQGKRVYRCSLRYIWVRERSSSANPHFHVLLLLNMDAYFTLGDFTVEHGRNMATRIKKAWASALGIKVEQVAGLVEFPKNPVYRLNYYADNFDQVKADLFRRVSYFAKLETKEYGTGSRSFGCSQR